MNIRTLTTMSVVIAVEGLLNPKDDDESDVGREG